MGWSGCIDGTADGDPRDTYIAVRAWIFGTGLKVAITPFDLLRGTCYAVWINGVWRGPNSTAEINGDIVMLFDIDPGTLVGSIWVEQVGAAETFDSSFIPSEYAEYVDAKTAPNLSLRWGDRFSTVPTYKNTPVFGDTQLSAITVTGAKRGLNVEAVPEFNTRGRLYYSIDTATGVHTVRWWSNGALVASGTGTGAIVCGAENESGLTINCTLAYTADVDKGTAWLDLRWPAAYPIHYSTAALTFPRAYQDRMTDNSADAYFYLSPALPSGVYNYNVLTEDDDGNVEAAPPVPADSPITIYAAPKPPAVTSVTAVVVAGMVTLTANFTPGETGCTFKGYRGFVNGPINFGQRTMPVPIGPTAVNATSLVFAAFAYTAIDNTADYAALVTSIDTVAAALNTAFVAGQTGFQAVLTTQAAAVDTAIATYATAIVKRIQAFIDGHDASVAAFNAILPTYTGVGLSDADWRKTLATAYGRYLATLSELLDSHPDHYTLPDGSLPGTLPDGSTGVLDLGRDNLLEAGTPLLQRAFVPVVIRATKGGVEEQGDNVFLVELQTSGAVQASRPNPADLLALMPTGLQAVFSIGVAEANALVAATSVELIINGTAVATAALPATTSGFHQAAITYTVPSSGWYQIVVRSISASGVRSVDSAPQEQYIGGNAAGAVQGLSAAAIRGKGF